jgi:hypothetical protein
MRDKWSTIAEHGSVVNRNAAILGLCANIFNWKKRPQAEEAKVAAMKAKPWELVGKFHRKMIKGNKVSGGHVALGLEKAYLDLPRWAV